MLEQCSLNSLNLLHYFDGRGDWRACMHYLLLWTFLQLGIVDRFPDNIFPVPTTITILLAYGRKPPPLILGFTT